MRAARIALVDVDGHHFPNLALMKLSAWHKAAGHEVDWYKMVLFRPDRIYASKVFTFTPDADFAAIDPEPVRGGTGYDAAVKLPDEVEAIAPDYSIYPQFREAYGFLTRGCIRSCPWCIVPSKEGSIRVAGDIERIASDRRGVVLMDNNFLAAPEAFVAEQLEKAARLKLRIDFNQGLDARLVTPENARLLAACKWIKYIRFSCDTAKMVGVLKNAVGMIRGAGYRGDIFVYVLEQNVDKTHDRIVRLCEIDRRIIPFCQPYRDFSTNAEPSEGLRRLARWCNCHQIRKTTEFKDYKVR